MLDISFITFGFSLEKQNILRRKLIWRSFWLGAAILTDFLECLLYGVSQSTQQKQKVQEEAMIYIYFV